MPAADPSRDPRIKPIQKALEEAGSMEAMCTNFQTRGNAALRELAAGARSEKHSKARRDLKNLDAAIKPLIKHAKRTELEYDNTLADYRQLKHKGDFHAFNQQLKRLAREADATKKALDSYNKTLSGATFDKNDLARYASLRGLENYSKQFMIAYGKFKPLPPKIASMKGDPNAADVAPAKDPRMKNIDAALRDLTSMEAMIDNFGTRGRFALKELKAAAKGEKNKAILGEYKTLDSLVTQLMKGARQSSSEADAIYKERQQLLKDGQFDDFAVKLRSRSAAFKITGRHAELYRKFYAGAKFEKKDLGRFSSLRGMENYSNMYVKGAKSYLAAIKKVGK